MKKYSIIGLVLIGLLVGGCDSEKVKDNLGDFQYIGIDPQLSIEIENQEIEVKYNEELRGVGITDYDVKLKYKINITQNNKELPLKNYSVTIVGNLIDEKNNVIDKNIHVYADVTNGVASITNSEDIYTDFKSLNKKEIESLKFVIDKYTWQPKIEYKPYKLEEK